MLIGTIVALWTVAFSKCFTEGAVRGEAELVFFSEELEEGEFISTWRLDRILRKFVRGDRGARSYCGHFDGEEKNDVGVV